MNTYHPPLKSPPSNRTPYSLGKACALLAAGAFTLLPCAAQAQVWETPYATGSTADLTLRFSNGATGNATSPDIPFAVGLSYNDTTAGLGNGGGWGLSATGTAAVGVIVVVGETHTRTTAGAGSMLFEMTTTGVSQIVGLSMGSKWYASSTISGSNLWVTPSNNFRYSFDVLLSDDILTLSPAIFDGYTLTIQAGSNILFQDSISGILPSLLPSVSGAYVDFEYDPSDGPLQISWDGNATVGTALLNALGNGSNTILQISNGAIQVDAIPEPGTYALMAASLGALAIYRRARKRHA